MEYWISDAINALLCPSQVLFEIFLNIPNILIKLDDRFVFVCVEGGGVS